VVLLFRKKEKLELIVNGMHCNSCASRVKSALKNVINISNVVVNLKENKVTITYQSDINQEEIKKIINDLGYTVS
jgi:Cu+-exporting ATPase